MKLLFAIKTLSGAVGGAERVLCMVCSALSARGHEVAIVSFDSPSSPPFYQLDEKVRLLRLNIGEPSKPASTFQTIKRMKKLRSVVSQESPDAVIGFMHSMFVPLSFALIGKKVPIIGSEHTSSEHYKNRLIQYLLFALSTPLMSRITVLSERIRQGYLFPIRNKMSQMPNPVKQTFNVDFSERIKHKTILAVGRLEELKGHEILIRSFKLVESCFPEWRLKIIGEGPLKKDLDLLIEQLNLTKKVHLCGFTKDIDTEYLYADLFIMPSRYEAFGLVTAEAMSHGLPAVGFLDCPGTNEVIEHRVTGILVDPKPDRINALASEIQNLMSNESLRKQLGQKAKLNIQDKYSLSVVAKKWEKLLLSNCKSGNV